MVLGAKSGFEVEVGFCVLFGSAEVGDDSFDAVASGSAVSPGSTELFNSVVVFGSVVVFERGAVLLSQALIINRQIESGSIRVLKRGAATAFPVQFDNSAVLRRFGSPDANKSFSVAVGTTFTSFTETGSVLVKHC